MSLFAVLWILSQAALVARARGRARPGGTMRYYLASLVLIVLLALMPFITLMLSAFIAGSAGCTLNEAGIHRCIIGGHDYGEVLYDMGMGIWFVIFTLPLAGAAFLIWVAVLIVHSARRRRDSGTA